MEHLNRTCSLLPTIYSSLPRLRKSFQKWSFATMSIRTTPNKMQYTYTRMWDIIREACPNSQPHYLFVDFEQAIINSFNLTWPLTQVKTWLFHLSQSVYRKLQSLGLQSEYHTYPEFAWLCVCYQL